MSQRSTKADISATAQEQAAGDAALAAALAARDKDVPAPAPEKTTQTIGDQFLDVADLIGRAKRNTRLSEQTLIKAWELNLMWIINNRQLSLQEAQRAQQFGGFPQMPDESGDEGTGEVETPEPNETITEESE